MAIGNNTDKTNDKKWNKQCDKYYNCQNRVILLKAAQNFQKTSISLSSFRVNN